MELKIYPESELPNIGDRQMNAKCHRAEYYNFKKTHLVFQNQWHVTSHEDNIKIRILSQYIDQAEELVCGLNSR